jgi:23S rRNA pseudouridine1911/1915/1917 synthase
MLQLQGTRLNQGNGKHLCWLGVSQSFESVLIELGFSKQRIKKSGLSKKERSRFIKNRDEITLPQELFNFGIINPQFIGNQIPNIIEKRGSIMAVHKPSHVHIHPFRYNENDNLLSFLRQQGHYSYIQKFSEDSPWDGGLLYRIDFETSGLVLLTNEREVYHSLQDIVLLKEYLVVVEGFFDLKDEVFIHYLSTSGAVVKENRDHGAECKIQVKVLKASEECSLLQVTLKEGRRHQIRVQLSLLGFPVWGDQLYGAKPAKKFGLHCYHYKLKNGLEFFDDQFWGLGEVTS